MDEFETAYFLGEARKHASAASFDLQKLSPDTVERQALHSLLNAVEALIQATDRSAE